MGAICAAVIGAFSVACGDHVPEEITVNQINLIRSTLYQGDGITESPLSRILGIGRGGLASRIFEIEPKGDGNRLKLVRSRGVVWVDSSGRVERELTFEPSPGVMFPVHTLRYGSTTAYVGLAKDRVVLFDTAGRLSGERACPDCANLQIAELVGGVDRVIIREMSGKGARVLNEHGDVVRTLRAPGFLTDVDAVELPNSEGVAFLLFVYPNKQGSGTMTVLRDDGSAVAEWPIPEARRTTRFVVGSAATGEPSALNVSGDDIVERRVPDGAILTRTRLPGAGAFRDVHTSWWRDGRRIFVLSGSGYQQAFMVAVVGASGSLLYQETGRERSYAIHVPSATTPRFLVAIGTRLVRYEEPRVLKNHDSSFQSPATLDLFPAR